ncbi:hypothetical protein DFP73DRAFT_559682 [Morchella snyderi]|nr:hypothetical protein DFP73DRAFT_559682 [Morchella snyderi]
MLPMPKVSATRIPCFFAFFPSMLLKHLLVPCIQLIFVVYSGHLVADELITHDVGDRRRRCHIFHVLSYCFFFS